MPLYTFASHPPSVTIRKFASASGDAKLPLTSDAMSVIVVVVAVHRMSEMLPQALLLNKAPWTTIWPHTHTHTANELVSMQTTVLPVYYDIKTTWI